MAGNTGVLKHASNVPQAALYLDTIFERGGFPVGSFRALMIGSREVKGVIEDRRVKAVTLTGSEAAGRSVASIAGDQIKKSVMELGGSDPFIVMPSADLEAAATTAVKARVQNNGQSCIAAKRFIVAEPVADRFEAEFVRQMEELTVGDPLDSATDVGPMAREDLLGDLDDQVKRTVEAGAHLATGGHPLPGKGWFYAPTVLLGVEPGMAAFDEETFGPVAAVVRARDTAHAIELANRSHFGLGASLWTADAARGEDIAAAIEAGSVFVNGVVKSDPRLPFGGIKSSGYGRELSEVGIREFVNIKTVWQA
jgi:succinate-semialdehyde dehydrogenase/glutarate-semialdehyde dehydrogenase